MICFANQVTGFFMKCSIAVKLVKGLLLWLFHKSSVLFSIFLKFWRSAHQLSYTGILPKYLADVINVLVCATHAFLVNFGKWCFSENAIILHAFFWFIFTRLWTIVFHLKYQQICSISTFAFLLNELSVALLSFYIN